MTTGNAESGTMKSDALKYRLNGTPLIISCPVMPTMIWCCGSMILAGDFIDYIFDEPDYIHELVRSQDLCLILKNMKEHQKQLLYYVVVRSYSTLQYAELNGKTDRNVRGVRETAIKQIRKKYKTALETRLLHLPWTLTLDEKYFLENGVRTKDEKNSEKQ